MTKTNVAWGTKFLLTIAIFLTTWFVGGCNDHISDANIQSISLVEARALLQGKPGEARAIDTRLPSEFAAAHIPGAIHLDLSAVKEDKDSIDPALARYDTLVVYGTDAGSGAARAMTKRLMRAGHKGVRLLTGGMSEWVGAGLRTEGTGATAPPAPPAPVSK